LAGLSIFSALLLCAAIALTAEPVTREVFFEGLDCVDEKPEIYVAALAAAQQLGYEIRDTGNAHEHFEGRLKGDDHRVELSVDITCSGVQTPGFEAFFGKPGVQVSARFRAKRGSPQAASQEAERFEERLRGLAERFIGEPSNACLGLSVRDAASLEPATQSRLGVETGAVVTEVQLSGPADSAGLEPWDVLLGIDGLEVSGGHSLKRITRGHGPGDGLSMLLVRDGETHRATLTLGLRSADGCLVVDHVSPKPPTPPEAAPRVALERVEVVPSPVLARSLFDVEMTLKVVLPSLDAAKIEVTLEAEILRDGEVLYRSSPVVVTCQNGAATEVVKHLRAGSEAGGYELRITALTGNLRDRRTVAFDIR
jgi:hypothetical protein